MTCGNTDGEFSANSMEPRVQLPEDWPIIAETATFEAAQAAVTAAGLGDGLPVVPPTARRLAAMLASVTEPARAHGLMPPMFGDLTSSSAAYCAVLAGCMAADLPVVVAAAKACLEPDFNLLGLMTTTGSACVATIVHGPAVAALGLNASINCLGPGHRVNATIGRAVSLVLRNIGGAKEGSGDMATVGQPGKYTFCFAEGDAGPALGFALLHARRGFSTGTSAVTVLGLSGTAEVLPVEGRDSPEAILDPIAASMLCAFEVNGAKKQPQPPEQVFILPPELAQQIHGRGWGLAQVQAYLFEATKLGGRAITPSPADIHPIVTGGPGVKIAHLALWGGGTRSVTRAVATL